MGRKREGSAYQKPRGTGPWYYAITLRSGAQFAEPMPLRTDGVRLDRHYCKVFAAEAQRRYDAGLWDPRAPALPPADDATLLAYARRWVATQTYGSASEDAGMIERYLAQHALGAMPLAAVRPRHVAEFVTWLKARPSEKGGTLAPRTVRNVYQVVRRVFVFAKFEERIATVPCELPAGILPGIGDKDPTARRGWKYARDAVEQLISDVRVPLDCRVTYALAFLTGMRFGEVAARRWRDWDRGRTPLGCLEVYSSIERRTRAEKGTKTGVARDVPVHPTLAAILAEWRLSGWAAMMGHAPTDDDWIVPTPPESDRPRRKGLEHGTLGTRRVETANRWLKRDCAKLAIRESRLHDTRRTFISLARDDRAGALLKWVTHTPPTSQYDQYTTPSWEALCAEVARLQVERRGTTPVLALPRAAGGDADSTTRITTVAGRNENGRRNPAAVGVRATGFEPVDESRHRGETDEVSRSAPPDDAHFRTTSDPLDHDSTTTGSELARAWPDAQVDAEQRLADALAARFHDHEARHGE